MKLIKKIWNMCGSEKGSCLILCMIITLATVVQFALDIVPSEFKEIIIALNLIAWFATFNIKDN